MSAIDKMSWHYDSDDYPKELKTENAGIHIGMYLAWAFSQGMVGEVHLEESTKALEKLSRREITGLDFLIYECDERLLDEDLSEEGAAFALDYYDDEASFAKKFGYYLQDYCDVFNAWADSQGFEYESLFHVENTWENFERLKPILEKRFKQWRNWRENQKATA